jgi:hypothetical protein
MGPRTEDRGNASGRQALLGFLIARGILSLVGSSDLFLCKRYIEQEMNTVSFQPLRVHHRSIVQRYKRAHNSNAALVLTSKKQIELVGEVLLHAMRRIPPRLEIATRISDSRPIDPCYLNLLEWHVVLREVRLQRRQRGGRRQLCLCVCQMLRKAVEHVRVS